MGGTSSGFNPSQSHFRAGVQECVDVPAKDADMTIGFRLVGETLTPTSTPTVLTTIVGTEDPELPLAGNVDVAGSLTFEVRGEGFNAFYAQAFGASATPVALPATGAFSHTISAAETDVLFPDLITIEINKDDGFPVRFWDCRVSSLTFTAADGAPMICEMGIIAGRNDYWDDAKTLNGAIFPGTGQMAKRGHAPLSTWDNLAAVRNSVVLEFVTLDTVAQTASVLAKWGQASALTGTATTTSASAVVTFVGGNLVQELQEGELVVIDTDYPPSAPAVVLTVDNKNQFTATVAAATGAVGETAFKTFGTTETPLLTGNDAQDVPQWNELVDGETGLKMGRERTGPNADVRVDAVEVYVTLDGLTTADLTVTGSLSVAIATRAVTGTGTAFDTELKPGMLLAIVGVTPVRIESVADATNLVLQADADATAGTAAATVRAQVEFASARPVWVDDIPDVPVFPEFLTTVTAGDRNYTPTTMAITYTPPIVATHGLGSRNARIDRTGQSTVAVSFTHRKKDLSITRFLETGGVLVATMLAVDGKAFIAGFDQEHTLLLTANVTAEGGIATVSAADATDEVFAGVGGVNSTAAKPSALTLDLVSSEADLTLL